MYRPVLTSACEDEGKAPMQNSSTHESFGCAQCWLADASTAHKQSYALASAARLIDESHYDVSIRVCASCAQAFVAVFTETIDWRASDDAQDWTLLPLTSAEAATLIQRAGALSETELETLAPTRRSLRRDHPTGKEASVFWGRGIRVGRHD